MSESAVVKSSIDLKDLTIKSASGVALYWVIDKVLTSDANYMEYVKVGLTGAVGLGVVAPILQNMIDGKDLMAGVTFTSLAWKGMLVDGALSAGIYYALKLILEDKINDDLLYKYVAIVCSVIGADMLDPWILAHMN